MHELLLVTDEDTVKTVICIRVSRSRLSREVEIDLNFFSNLCAFRIQRKWIATFNLNMKRKEMKKTKSISMRNKISLNTLLTRYISHTSNDVHSNICCGAHQILRSRKLRILVLSLNDFCKFNCIEMRHSNAQSAVAHNKFELPQKRQHYSVHIQQSTIHSFYFHASFTFNQLPKICAIIDTTKFRSQSDLWIIKTKLLWMEGQLHRKSV